MFKKFFLPIFIFSSSYLNAQSLFINEIMPSNVSGIMDDLYDFPDSWVEIYNAGEEPVNIKDFFSQIVRRISSNGKFLLIV